MGEKAEDITLTFGVTPDTIEDLLILFDRHFSPRKNIIFERNQFNTRNQLPDESLEEYITALYKLAKSCEFCNMTEDMIRDRLVAGMENRQLSERLQLVDNLTLSKAITIGRQVEDVKRQQHSFPASSTIDRVKQVYPKRDNYENNIKKECSWCGHSPSHARSQCPARNALCFNCKNKGHFSKMCRFTKPGGSKTGVRQVNQEESNQDECDTLNVDNLFIGSLTLADLINNKWEVLIEINNKGPYKFCLDTGADATVLPSIMAPRNISVNTKKLIGPDNKNLDVTGTAKIDLKLQGRTITEQVYFIKNLQTPLLGKPAIQKFNLLQAINHIQIHDIFKDFSTMFTGIGEIPTFYKIRLTEGAEPYSIFSPRPIALPLLDTTKKELEKLVNQNIICEVEEPTEWCAPIVVIPKKNNEQGELQVRICIDFTRLNASVKREVHPIPKISSILARLTNARIFSRLDANCGFYQILLDPDSQLLTTFLTPFGRFKFKRLPFGIRSAPEVFQRTMEKILKGCDGLLCMMDDIIIFGNTREEHDSRLIKVLYKLKEAGVKLNKAKTIIAATEIQILGHVISREGVRPDDDKIKAIAEMAPPLNKEDLQRFLGLVTFVGRHIPHKSDMLEPLNCLLRKDTIFQWDHPQKESFEKIKQYITTKPVLAVYDSGKETIVTADASSFGIGGALLQRQEDGNVRPVAYVSKSLNQAEKNYAQIEKEALAVAWVCTKLEEYILGLPKVTIETDHKPLVSIFSNKPLDTLSPRLLRFRIRMMKYSYTIIHVPGKLLVTADALSRKPLSTEIDNCGLDTQEYINALTVNITDRLLENLKDQTKDNQELNQLKKLIINGWPRKEEVPANHIQYWGERNNFTICEDLVWKGNRIVVPSSLREHYLNLLHAGHQGITKCTLRAQSSVWWPKISASIEHKIKNCTKCIEQTINPKEPLLPSPLPDRPWQKVASDLFAWKCQWYIVVIDYFSRFLELHKLSNISASAVIAKLKEIFARQGIPEILFTDNGTQYIAMTNEITNFSKDYGFHHITSSPRYPQSNGEAEAAVKIGKKIITKCDDPYMGLLIYNTTPLANGYSPSQLLMCRQLRTNIPLEPTMYNSALPNMQLLRQKERDYKTNQKQYYDKRHRSRNLSTLKTGQWVWIKDLHDYGTIQDTRDEPRSYTVKVRSGQVRRNRWSLVPAPSPGSSSPHEASSRPPSPDSPVAASEEEEREDVVTRSGRIVKLPVRLNL